MLNIERTDAPVQTRGERVHLPEELVTAVEESILDGKAVTATFETLAEAKGVHTKLRTRMNEQGYGLRAWKPVENEDEGTVSITFLGKAQKQATGKN